MKISNTLKEFKELDSKQISEKINELRKELFDLRFKNATRQLSETHKFKNTKKQIAQLLTLSKIKSNPKNN
tara:strand:+ start:7444 stop:7656 length:213 start_codon:yes stop_codon:yes gene_type:complete